MIVLGDIQGSKYFKPFVQENENEQFILLGDLFDRGSDSQGVYETIKSLDEKKQLQFCFGNHDLYFIFGIGFSPLYKGFLLSQVPQQLHTKYYHFSEQCLDLLQSHGGAATLKSLLHGLTQEQYSQKLNEVASFLWNKGKLYLFEQNNLYIHGGIPIHQELGFLGEILINKDYTNNLFDYLNLLNEKLLQLDLSILTYLTLNENDDHNVDTLLYDLESKGRKLTTQEKKSLFTIDCNPVNYLNNYYFQSEKLAKQLKIQLQQNDIHRLFVGHSGNKQPVDQFNDINSEYWKHMLRQENTILQLDRSSLKFDGNYENFGYCHINKDSQIIQIRDYLYSEK